MDRDEIIRDLAKLHGADNIGDSQLREIRGHLENSYIDSVLDGKLDTPAQTGEANAK